MAERIAATIKGDLGPVGIYSAVGYYLAQRENIFLMGLDTSFSQNLTQIILQGEYIYDKVGIGSYLSNLFINYSNLNNKEFGNSLVVGRVNYSLNDFNSLKLTTIVHMADGSLGVIPAYEKKLTGNLDLNLRYGLFLGASDEIFGSQEDILEITLSYPF